MLVSFGLKSKWKYETNNVVPQCFWHLTKLQFPWENQSSNKSWLSWGILCYLVDLSMKFIMLTLWDYLAFSIPLMTVFMFSTCGCIFLNVLMPMQKRHLFYDREECNDLKPLFFIFFFQIFIAIKSIIAFCVFIVRNISVFLKVSMPLPRF